MSLNKSMKQAPRRQLACDTFPSLSASLDEVRGEVTDQWVGERVCREIVEDLVAASEPDVVGAYMDEVAVPWAVQGVLTDVVEALALAFLEREAPPEPPSLTVGQGRAARAKDIPDPGAVAEDDDSDAASSVDELDQLRLAAQSVMKGSDASASDGKTAEAKADGGDEASPVISLSAPPADGDPLKPQQTEQPSGDSTAPSAETRAPNGGSRPPTASSAGRSPPVAAVPVPPSDEGLRWSEAGLEPAPMSEPVLVPADSWCRASIQQRRRVTERRPSAATTELGMSDENRAASFAPRRGARRVASGDGDAARKGQGGLSTSNPSLKPGASQVFSNASMASVGGSGMQRTRSTRKSDGGSGADDGTSTNADGRQSPGDGADEEHRLQQSVAENMSRMKALRAMSESVQRQINALAGRSGQAGGQFVVDGATHQVVEVTSVDAKHLPPSRAEMRVNVPGAAAAGGKDAGADDGGKKPGTASGARGRAATPGDGSKPPGGSKPARKKREGENASNFFQPEPNANPMVSDVMPAAGVTHRDGDSVKTAELKPSKAQVSRHEYSKLLSLQAAAVQQPMGLGDDSNAPPMNPTTGVLGTSELQTSSDGKQNDSSSPGGQQSSSAAVDGAKKKPPTPAVGTRVATPGAGIPRPSSENSARRHPSGGVVPHHRTIDRVSTPTVGMRPTGTIRPSSTASARKAVAASTMSTKPQSAQRAPRAAPLARMRVFDTDDDAAREFLSGLGTSDDAAADL